VAPFGRLFETSGADNQVASGAATRNRQMGLYGPASMDIDAGNRKAAEKGLIHDFAVLVKRSCDAGDPNEEL